MLLGCIYSVEFECWIAVFIDQHESRQTLTLPGLDFDAHLFQAFEWCMMIMLLTPGVPLRLIVMAARCLQRRWALEHPDFHQCQFDSFFYGICVASC